MANTILEKLQEKYPNATGINDARNIAEAVACINGTGGRGANAIADHIYPQYTLTFDLNGGSGTANPVTAAPVTPITLPDGTGLTPVAGKEAFLGWGATAEATTAVTSPVLLEEDTTLYAIWGDIFTVEFDANGGTGTVESVTCPDGESITLPDGTGLTAPENKEFAGWGTTADATEVLAAEYTPEADVTLYAVYSTVEAGTPDPEQVSG